ncbi:MAG: prepilin-type N-terminal cleavage/methylation domain-containing protein [bacterium]|nr:prepilin-type N-terminal cleavage/methylation domain-containing protein [bacterium]
MLIRKRQQGFSIIELVLVVAIIGIIASILIPNLIDALHKAKQRRTMAELRLVGTAWMSWLTDQAGAASAGANQTYAVDNHREVSYAELFGYLHPSDTFFYMQGIPEYDAWGSSLTFYMNEDPRTDNQLLLCAAARDNIPETCDGSTDIPIGPFLATDFDQDIIWADGFLLRWPDIK